MLYTTKEFFWRHLFRLCAFQYLKLGYPIHRKILINNLYFIVVQLWRGKQVASKIIFIFRNCAGKGERGCWLKISKRGRRGYRLGCFKIYRKLSWSILWTKTSANSYHLQIIWSFKAFFLRRMLHKRNKSKRNNNEPHTSPEANWLLRVHLQVEYSADRNLRASPCWVTIHFVWRHGCYAALLRWKLRGIIPRL